jgi:CrcB protein
LRYLISDWLFWLLDKPWFPVGTLAVNLLGCLAIGFLGGIAEGRRIFDPQIRLLVFVGILGGFTIFSAFAYETASLAHEARLAAALLNIALASHRWVIGRLVRRSNGAFYLTAEPRFSGQEFLNKLEPWLNLGRLTNSGEVFYGEKTRENRNF